MCFWVFMAAESPPCGYTHPCRLRSVPQHFGHPHRKFSSHHLLLVFPMLWKSFCRFGEGSCREDGIKLPVQYSPNLSSICPSLYLTFHRPWAIVNAWGMHASIGGLNFTAASFADWHLFGTLCIQQQFGFRFVYRIFPFPFLVCYSLKQKYALTSI